MFLQFFYEQMPVLTTNIMPHGTYHLSFQTGVDRIKHLTYGKHKPSTTEKKNNKLTILSPDNTSISRIREVPSVMSTNKSFMRMGCESCPKAEEG